MMTNTYTPMIGGIEESIRSFTGEFSKLGHEVVVIAPQAAGAPPDEKGVIRLRAIQKFSHTDFSIALPMQTLLPKLMRTFTPDIIHSHHPFWMGDVALRLSRQYSIPLIFTYHTMFEQHMHYLPLQNEGIKRFIIELFTGYANLADQVVVPSESVRDILLERGVKTPMAVVPTGVNLQRFSRGDGGIIRKRFNISSEAALIGYIGRLVLEKNLDFLARSVAEYMKKDHTAHFLVAGKGPLEGDIKRIFDEAGLGKRLHLAGLLNGQDLVDAYYAMNIFAFASLSETQGVVLVEAMACGVPAVAIDAPGVREVVKDSTNGRLIPKENKNDFIEALSWCLKRPPGEMRRMKQNAIDTAVPFAVELCASRMLKIYEEARGRECVSSEQKDNAWYALASRLKVEWNMFKNMMEAGGAAMTEVSLKPKQPVAKRSRGWLAQLSGLLNRSEWSTRLLRLNRSEQTETQPGVVLIQIDGFSMTQLKQAFANREMPFLKGLLQKKYYRLYSFYPGLPSSTPSVQGELFYGIKQCVPAFSFKDTKTGRIFRMYDSEAAVEIEQRLAKQGEGLLKGGSSYSNIFSGGSEESHFCATLLGWDRIWKDINPINLIILALTHLPSFVRMCVLTAYEMFLGVIDFWRGLYEGENFKKESKFIYLRALICILLRELVTVGAKIDITRGLPIIHLNFLGYDEHAHNRGASSKSAHWALRGIDHAIERIYRKALRSARRSYDVWIYSDHGQEDTVSYAVKYGRSVQEAVAEVFKEFGATDGLSHHQERKGVQLHRARLLGFPFIEKMFGNMERTQKDSPPEGLVVTAIGPTGNIYLPQPFDEEQKKSFAKKLVETAKIPVVMVPLGQGEIYVWTEEGEFILPRDAGRILGGDHPFLMQVTQDLIRVCHHPDAGDFTFMGYRPGKQPMTFPVEDGAHAGVGPEETNAFALLPIDVIKMLPERRYLTPMDLRHGVFRFLKRPMLQEPKKASGIFVPAKAAAASETVRIMTYNVHGCIGMDGKISPERIARVIGRHQPDIVALQELDMQRKRTGGIDQPHVIAKQLEMMYHFHPSIQVEEEHYGNAVLSRYPMELIRAGRLPGRIKNSMMEPRGAVWTAINVAGQWIHFFNTHLGLFPQERILQAKSLLGSEWLAHPACAGPVVLCGDFNALPNSQLVRQIKKILCDAQAKLKDHDPRPTWFSRYPMGRIDHVFISPGIEVTHVEVSGTDLDKLASDHLPLIVDLKIPIKGAFKERENKLILSEILK